MIERLVRWARADDAKRAALLAFTSILCAALLVGHLGQPVALALHPGDVAPRTVKAAESYRYVDVEHQRDLEAAAAEAVPRVYVRRADLADDATARIAAAFEAGRMGMAGHPAGEPVDPAILAAFVAALDARVDPGSVGALAAAGFSPEAEALTRSLAEGALGTDIVVDASDRPVAPAQVVTIRGTARSEELRSIADAATPDEVRASIAQWAAGRDTPWAKAAGDVAAALVRPNLAYDPLVTQERERDAVAAIPKSDVTVKRGTTLFRQGDVLGVDDVRRYRAQSEVVRVRGGLVDVASAALFIALLLAATFGFCAATVSGFSSRPRDAAAAGALLVLVAALVRVGAAAAEPLAGALALDVDPSTVPFGLPIAGVAIAARMLLGPAWAMALASVAGLLAGLGLDLGVVPAAVFTVAGLAGAAASGAARERIGVLRAGAVAGLVGAAAVLLAHPLEVAVGMVDVDATTALRPVWAMALAGVGGLGSGAMVLAVVPLFEAVGFWTDWRLMELASLNHPLLRNLMVRAPGSYHHSVMVGTLAESACEAIGANALQARVAAYFHDVGKALKPQYFAENQRGMPNRHDTIDPRLSARMILEHVTEGGRLAREHRLPQPIIDNIFMHHGTGLLSMFYDKARGDAKDPATVLESDFRYPGPKPSTREAGVIMLADKVEAATRTIREPTEPAIRAMIQKIVNATMADGQFEACPLTVAEIYTVIEVFVQVLLGIHHQRIEYSATQALSRGETPEVPAANVITLEIPSPLRVASAAPELEDYESVEHLGPGERGSKR